MAMTCYQSGFSSVASSAPFERNQKYWKNRKNPDDSVVKAGLLGDHCGRLGNCFALLVLLDLVRVDLVQDLLDLLIIKILAWRLIGRQS